MGHLVAIRLLSEYETGHANRQILLFSVISVCCDSPIVAELRPFGKCEWSEGIKHLPDSFSRKC